MRAFRRRSTTPSISASEGKRLSFSERRKLEKNAEASALFSKEAEKGDKSYGFSDVFSMSRSSTTPIKIEQSSVTEAELLSPPMESFSQLEWAKAQLTKKPEYGILKRKASGLIRLESLKSKPYDAQAYANASATADETLAARIKTREGFNQRYSELDREVKATVRTKKSADKLDALTKARENIFALYEKFDDKVQAWEKVKRHIARRQEKSTEGEK
jgi:hypothetical protein